MNNCITDITIQQAMQYRRNNMQVQSSFSGLKHDHKSRHHYLMQRGAFSPEASHYMSSLLVNCNMTSALSSAAASAFLPLPARKTPNQPLFGGSRGRGRKYNHIASPAASLKNVYYYGQSLSCLAGWGREGRRSPKGWKPDRKAKKKGACGGAAAPPPFPSSRLFLLRAAAAAILAPAKRRKESAQQRSPRRSKEAATPDPETSPRNVKDALLIPNQQLPTVKEQQQKNLAGDWTARFGKVHIVQFTYRIRNCILVRLTFKYNLNRDSTPSFPVMHAKSEPGSLKGSTE
uniref:uncharacterized protein LOC114585505 n=1 Tax=Podarcis muralis TaxID=64176 RepID=UPI0010A09617|nr:uncharacterized protein LOC114585505 [Podarcis muralis]